MTIDVVLVTLAETSTSLVEPSLPGLTPSASSLDSWQRVTVVDIPLVVVVVVVVEWSALVVVDGLLRSLLNVRLR